MGTVQRLCADQGPYIDLSSTYVKPKAYEGAYSSTFGKTYTSINRPTYTLGKNANALLLKF